MICLGAKERLERYEFSSWDTDVANLGRRALILPTIQTVEDEMIETGWRCGPELYREIIKIFQGI